MRHSARRFWFLSGGLLLLYSVPSILFMGFANMGNFALAALGAAAVCTPFFWEHLHRRGRIWLSVLWSIATIVMASLTALMLFTAYAAVPDADNPPGTVIVLGAKLSGDSPSQILRNRLTAALDYLQAHPEANVVVSGGLGEGEQFTEAEVMRRWLMERGISPARIFEEDASTVTSENLAYSAAVIRESGLDSRVVICTDGFHQLRAAVFARKNGLEPSSLSSSTPPGLIPMYYVREWFGLVKALVLGT